MKNIVITLGTALTLATLVGLTVVYAGLFNVSTSWKDPALIRWVLATTRENAVKSRAASIKVPPMKGTQQVEEGFRSYREMCASCHTPPGASASPIAQGLNPEPPDLAKRAEQMSSAELFWVIKNGIRMTGMPAWGPTHKDEELWNIVAFVKTLPNMSSEDYRTLDQQASEGHGHSDGGHNEEGGESGHGDDSHHDEADEFGDRQAH